VAAESAGWAEIAGDTAAKAAKDEVMAQVARGRVEGEVAEGAPGKLRHMGPMCCPGRR
jgi:hypothetical protein